MDSQFFEGKLAPLRPIKQAQWYASENSEGGFAWLVSHPSSTTVVKEHYVNGDLKPIPVSATRFFEDEKINAAANRLKRFSPNRGESPDSPIDLSQEEEPQWMVRLRSLPNSQEQNDAPPAKRPKKKFTMYKLVSDDE